MKHEKIFNCNSGGSHGAVPAFRLCRIQEMCIRDRICTVAAAAICAALFPVKEEREAA